MYQCDHAHPGTPQRLDCLSGDEGVAKDRGETLCPQPLPHRLPGAGIGEAALDSFGRGDLAERFLQLAWTAEQNAHVDAELPDERPDEVERKHLPAVEESVVREHGHALLLRLSIA